MISLLIAVHFSGLLLAWSSNLSPSLLQGELQRWFAPIHVSTGLDHIMLPLQLTDSATMEAPALVQFRIDADDRWQTLELPGVRTGEGWVGEILPGDFSLARSRWGSVGRLLTWIAVEQPDSEILPAFLKQTLSYALKQEQFAGEKRIAEVRLFQPHPLTFDEHMTLINNPRLASMVEEQLSGKALYTASVVKGSNGELLLVTRDEARRTAAAKPVTDEPDTANQP